MIALGFGKKKKDAAACIIMDSMSRVLAKGRLEKAQQPDTLRVKVTEGDVKAVLHTNKVQVVPAQEDHPAALGRVIDCDDHDVVTFQTLRELKGAQVRTNLRMPVGFSSYAYPLSGPSKARVPIMANDLSGGGISFFCDSEFAPGDLLEVVIPITRTAPLLLQCQVLRKGQEVREHALYACKFSDIIDEQEALVREAVFRAQVTHIRRLQED